MTTNIQIISDALLEIGVINESETPSAEQGQHALRKLNQMLEAWEEDGIRLQWCEQTDTTETAPLPPYAERGVTLQLAIELAPSYGGAASVSEVLAVKADEAFMTIKRKAAVSNMTSQSTRSMPAAEGGVSSFNILTG